MTAVLQADRLVTRLAISAEAWWLRLAEAFGSLPTAGFEERR